MQYRERVIFIGDEINEEFSNQILATMLYLDSLDSSKKLFMFISGPGGDVSSYQIYLLSKFLVLLESPPFSFKICT